jgi:hypothetical protein
MSAIMCSPEKMQVRKREHRAVDKEERRRDVLQGVGEG